MLIYEDFDSIWGSMVDTFRYFFDVFSETFSGSDSGAISINIRVHFHDFFEVGGARECERHSLRETAKTLAGADQDRGPTFPAELGIWTFPDNFRHLRSNLFFH